MNLHTLWAVAVCEMRSCCRLVRSWVIMVLASLVATVFYLVFCIQHMAMSTMAPSAQILSPRFMVGQSASQFVGLFAIGIIFLAFDIRSRDIRDRINGIIDAKPVSNFELVVGRLGGILMLFSVPILVFLAIVLLHGTIAGFAGWSFGAPIEIWSVLSFLVWDVVPQLAWWGGLVMLLAIVLRNRLLAVLVAVGLLSLYFWILTKLSWGHVELAGAVTSQIVHPSDVAPVFVTGTTLIHRVSWLLISIGLLALAATFLPRLLPRRGIFGLAGVGTLTVGVLMQVGLFNAYSHDREQIDTWARIHQSQDVSSFPDVKHMGGTIDIRPGRRIELNLSLTVSPPQDNQTDQVTFSLNPGYKVRQVTIDDKKIDDYFFEDGLLTIPSNHFGVSNAILAIEAYGKPDDRFAYLDERIDLKSTSVVDLNVAMAQYLGSNSYVFQSGYVALLPGVSWYPTAGVAIGRDDLQNYPRDHFTLDVEVTVPKGWKVAGPGKEEKQSANRRKNTYQFLTENPVLDVALIGSKFKQVSTTVDDIKFEVLYSAKHRKTFEALEPLVPKLKEWISERLTKVEQRYGLRYPYKTLTFVEVPAHLRVLGGGWSMDSTLFAPGVVMIRETGFPTARFDISFRDPNIERSFQALVDYFDNDLQGGTLLNGVARNFVNYQTSPAGRGAIALNYFIEDLVGELTVERLPYFTTDTALSPLGFGQVGLASATVGESSVSVSVGVGIPENQNADSRSGAAILRDLNIHRISSWSKIEDSTVGDLNFREEPILSYDAILLRNTYALQGLKEWMDRESLGLALKNLLQQYKGSNFTYDNFRDVMVLIEPQFEDITQYWINTNKLPGFVVSESSIESLITDDPERPIFQTVFNLRNAESIPGLVNVRWFEEQPFGANSDDTTTQSWPTMLIEPNSSYKIAIKSTQKPTQIEIDAPMSLNRYPIKLKVPNLDEVPSSKASPSPDRMPIQWNPDRSDHVIVDDLDPGFSVSGEPQELKIPGFLGYFIELGLQAAGVREQEDRGLPVTGWFFQQQWTRTQDSGFGRYRNTYARVHSVSNFASEESIFRAEFAANLPSTGVWALEFCAPGEVFGNSEDDYDQGSLDSTTLPVENNSQNTIERGNLRLVIRVNDESIPIDLNFYVNKDSWETLVTHDDVDVSALVEVSDKSLGDVQEANWISVGSFDITDAHVVVEVSNNHASPFTFADAVRWTRLQEESSVP